MGRQSVRRVKPEEFPGRTVEDLRRREYESRHQANDEAMNKLSQLQLKLKRETKRLMPECTSCGSTNVKTKTSSHLIDPGNNAYGPAGRGPRFSTNVEFLYCEDCGTTYYKRGVAKLERLMLEIREADDELSRLRNPRMC